jgi:cardiolipin synthase
MTFSPRWIGRLAAVAATGALGSAAQTGQAAPRAHVTASQLTLVAEPQAGVAPFLKMIDGARTSIDLTMYELFDQRLEQALVAAEHREVDVRVLLNGGYYSEREDTNAHAYSYLHSHGVHVRYSPTYFALTHQKTLTVDGRESAIMTLNFDDLYASTRDYAVIDSQPADVTAVTAAFNADYAGQRITASTGTGDLVWSPGTAPTILRMIHAARHSIDLEDEEMAYAPATSALCDAARSGVAVRVVMTFATEWQDDFAQLERCGVSVHLYHGQRYYIHAKLLLVDGRRALVSSQNLSTGSLSYNRELGITITTPALLTELAGDFASDYAGA